MEVFHAKGHVALNKPRGVMCTAHDPEGRKPSMTCWTSAGLFTVGRLDYNTEVSAHQ